MNQPKTQPSYLIEPTIPTVSVVGASSVFAVRRVYCVGRNYIEHIREMKEGDERDPPFFFQKPSDSLVGTNSSISYPAHTEDFQFEVELVVAIGARANDVKAEDALDHVFGYAVGIDMTRRDRQREARERGQPWEVGKSFDHSAPCGPLSKVVDVGHMLDGEMSLSVGGKVRQRTSLSLMIWNVPEIISNLSRQYQLEPGDLIFTGTPAGVGPLKPGDTIHAEIAGLAPLDITITGQKARPQGVLQNVAD